MVLCALSVTPVVNSPSEGYIAKKTAYRIEVRTILQCVVSDLTHTEQEKKDFAYFSL